MNAFFKEHGATKVKESCSNWVQHLSNRRTTQTLIDFYKLRKYQAVSVNESEKYSFASYSTWRKLTQFDIRRLHQYMITWAVQRSSGQAEKTQEVKFWTRCPEQFSFLKHIPLNQWCIAPSSHKHHQATYNSLI